LDEEHVEVLGVAEKGAGNGGQGDFVVAGGDRQDQGEEDDQDQDEADQEGACPDQDGQALARGAHGDGSAGGRAAACGSGRCQCVAHNWAIFLLRTRAMKTGAPMNAAMMPTSSSELGSTTRPAMSAVVKRSAARTADEGRSHLWSGPEIGRASCRE